MVNDEWLNIDRFNKLEQYTGLKDKNDKESFVNDLLKRPDGPIGQLVYPLIDKYGNEWAAFGLKFSGFETVVINAKEMKTLEIVGDIYNNPEFLEVKNG